MYIRSTTLRNTLVGPVPSLKIQVRGPIVGKVLRELASRATRSVRNIALCHRYIETVASHNLMDVTRRNLSRVDERINSVDYDLSASKSQHSGPALSSLQNAGLETGCSLGERRNGEERGPKHFEGVEYCGKVCMPNRRGHRKTGRDQVTLKPEENC